MAEFELIDLVRARAVHARDDVVLGIGDDAAVLRLPAGRELVVAMDTLNEGVHFPAGTAPADIGWKALAVNLSDLAAMGAVPAWCTLSLSLPQGDAGWVTAFLEGFMALAAEHRVALVGGDTTRGPLSIAVTVHGFVASGAALRRDGARVGDDVWVTGTLGDAGAALAQWRDRGTLAAIDAPLRLRLERPLPRIAFGQALAGVAHAALDISDGLLADLGHVCAASGVGAEVDVDALPASDALRNCVAGDALRALQASGGDDYELCFTAPAHAGDAIRAAAHASGVAVTRIGTIMAGSGVGAHSAGEPWRPSRGGHEHFSD